MSRLPIRLEFGSDRGKSGLHLINLTILFELRPSQYQEEIGTMCIGVMPKSWLNNNPSLSFIGNGALLIWGDVDRREVDEDALNDWWTNEHLPERLSIPGFLRARRYCCNDGNGTILTKYLTLYEVSNLSVLTSGPYMKKLDNPTKGTRQHIPTLATMQRSACDIVHSEVRRDLAESCLTGLGATIAMVVLMLPPDGGQTATTLRDILSRRFVTIQETNKSAMALSLLQEDPSATQPGSQSQSYDGAAFQRTPHNDDLVKWIILLEFSTTRSTENLGTVTSLVDYISSILPQPSRTELNVYGFLCSASG
ncbi:hypothetical protein LTR37_005726 [Vermiconidia calcicola]|uniref:Uncharacterized protein n=1 Tax=Vermiconidia calcicola TaxID=1690605 RepID=A0ACC3NIH4_9PEZI|nr:hypothetical protein LTR37_005726 [Vermiconidia calcicola]